MNKLQNMERKKRGGIASLFYVILKNIANKRLFILILFKISFNMIFIKEVMR